MFARICIKNLHQEVRDFVIWQKSWDDRIQLNIRGKIFIYIFMKDSLLKSIFILVNFSDRFYCLIFNSKFAGDISTLFLNINIETKFK